MCTAPGLGGSSHLFLPRRHYQSFWITWYLIILFGCRCRFTSTCMWHLELGRAMGIKQVGFCNKRIFYILATMLRSSPFPHLIGFSFLSVALCIASSTLPLLPPHWPSTSRGQCLRLINSSAMLLVLEVGTSVAANKKEGD